MRGYGRSTVHPRQEDYAMEHIVYDMIELLDSLGYEKAIWVGHDWGSPVAWGVASHHPDRCHGVASLCVPYIKGFTLDERLPLIDRTIYPAAEYPAGQWDYQYFYAENFEKAHKAFEADIRRVVKTLFRKGNPDGVGKPAFTASIRRNGGWFGGGPWPDLPRDGDVLTEQDQEAYIAALTKNGFFGPDAWYMNNERNAGYAQRAKNGGKLSMPVLFLHGAYDTTCETMTSRFPEPMRRDCSDLTEVVVKCGHWMAQEKPVDVNAALAKWMAGKLPDYWR
jgi:pimeloyl-ACP methyl ester carboxylesterase